MKKVMHLVNTGNYSGLENVAINICKLLDDYAHVYVSPSGVINNILFNNGVEHKVVNKLSIATVDKLIKEMRPDIIHCHDVTASVLGGLLSFKYPKIQIISHLHNNDPKMAKFSLRWGIYSVMLRKFDTIFVVSQSVINEYKGNLIGNATVLNNIVILPKIINCEKKYDIVMVARLEPQKRPLLFIDIVKKIKIKVPNVRVAYVGDGSMKQIFLREIKEANLESTIEYKGFLDNPYQIMKKSKIFLLTSEFEGFGLVALEALMLGLPAIVTNVGGLPYIVDDTCGLITNNENELILETIDLIKKTKKYQKKSQNAFKKADKVNNVQKFKDKIRSAYEK